MKFLIDDEPTLRQILGDARVELLTDREGSDSGVHSDQQRIHAGIVGAQDQVAESRVFPAAIFEMSDAAAEDQDGQRDAEKQAAPAEDSDQKSQHRKQQRRDDDLAEHGQRVGQRRQVQQQTGEQKRQPEQKQ